MSGSSSEKRFSFRPAGQDKMPIAKPARLSPQKARSLMQQGARQLNAGQFPQAVETFSAVQAAMPRNPSANYYLGFALHGDGDPERAGHYYRRALEEKPGMYEAWLNLANVQMLLEQHAEAEQSFARALKLRPDAAAALYGQGMALGAQDKHDQAAEQFQNAYEHDKNSVDIRNNLITSLIKSESWKRAVEVIEQHSDASSSDQLQEQYSIALLGVGRLDKAESILQGLHRRDPANQETIYNLARLYQDQSQFEKSLEYFQKLENRETDISILSSLGAVLDALGRFTEAEQVLHKALKLNQNDVKVLNHLGNALTGSNKTEDAEAMYRRAIAIQGNSAMSHNNLGFALAARGHTDEAVAEYNKAIAIKPDYGESYRNLVTVKKIAQGDDPLVAQMIEQIHDPHTSDQDRVQFGFALGKALDDSGLYDQAFKYYKLANDIVASSRPFNVESFEHHVDDIVTVFSREFFENLERPLGSDSDMPVFVVGMSRSGTTLAEKIISSHPMVQGAGELGKLFEIIKKYEKRSQSEYPFALREPDPQLLLAAANDYLDYVSGYISDGYTRHIVDKMPYNFSHLGFIALALPHAKIVHCKRDPMDTCLSNYFQYFPRGISCLYDLKQLAGYYRQYQRLMAHWNAVLPIPFYDLQYEHLIADQEAVTRELIDFLGLEWDGACLASHKSRASVRTASIWQVRQPIYDKSVQRWRNYEKHLGPLKIAFGIE